MSVAFGMAADGRFVARVDGRIVDVASHASLDELLAAPRAEWGAAIDAVRTYGAHADDASAKAAPGAPAESATSATEPELALPFTVADYVDFYSSLEHATFFGRLLRPESDPLPPNWRALPVGYHGRASTIVVSGTPIRRPFGQTPDWGPTQALDLEVELGFVVGGAPNHLGQPIPIEHAAERIFGVVLLCDWSARDIQAFESRPLGPFLSKAFATTISAWVVPVDELRRVPGPRQSPTPAAYLQGGGDWNFDVEIEVELNGERITRTNSRRLYWSAAQQLAHLASGGAIVRPGDLLGTGTISGAEQDQGGSLMEMGRPFLADGDEVVFRSEALGDLSGTILPATA